MSSDALLGTVIADRYRLDALLGEGGMGRVYAAHHVLMRKRLAVKVLHRQLTQVPEVVQRFEREALAAAHIEHPGIAAATDFGKLPDGSVYLVLEFVEGRSLRDEIASGPLAVARALHIGRQIASALAAAHALSIVHRDLKPENVMLVEKGGDRDFVKVLDFGIAKVPIGEDGNSADGKTITKAGMVYGTPEYMAPEQALGQNVDGRADLYALGVILYEMLAGVRPFGGKSQVGILGQQLTQPVPSFAVRAPGTSIPPAVESFVMRLLAREADERIQTAAEVVAGFDALLGTVPPPEERLFTLFGGSPSTVMAPPSTGSAPDGLLPSLSGSSAAPSVEAPEAPSLTSTAPDPRASRADIPPPALAPVETVWDRMASSVQRLRPWAERWAGSLRRAAEHLDERKATLPAGLGRVLRGVPGSVLLGALSLVGVIVVVTGITLLIGGLGSASSAEASSAASSDASTEHAAQETSPAPGSLAERLAQAEATGVEALQALAQAEPTEASVLVALASAQAKAGRFADAVQTVSDALAIDPKLNESPRIAGVLFRAAQAPASQEAAFRLLQGPMGTRGADILYDLANTEGVRSGVKARAAKIVASEEFRQSASPALSVALDLKKARTCTAYAGLLERAQHVGDARALALLKPLTQTTGCGPGGKSDCYPCLRGDDRLAKAIATIEKRIAPTPSAKR